MKYILAAFLNAVAITAMLFNNPKVNENGLVITCICILGIQYLSYTLASIFAELEND